jgi:hypothetical protein
VASGSGQEAEACACYAIILLSTEVGVTPDFAGVNPVKALYWTAVINGLLAPFLLLAILVVASDAKLMRGQPSSRLGLTVVRYDSGNVCSGHRYVCCVDHLSRFSPRAGVPQAPATQLFHGECPQCAGNQAAARTSGKLAASG